jgi:hypothetical protein
MYSCPESEKAAYREAVWFPHQIFLGPRSDIDALVEAMHKVSTVFIRDLILSGRMGALKILHASFSERHKGLRPLPPGSLTGGLPEAARSWIWAFIAYTRHVGWPARLLHGSRLSSGPTTRRCTAKLRRGWRSPCFSPVDWSPRQAPATARRTQLHALPRRDPGLGFA